MTMSSADAEDLVQDVCLKVLPRLDELEQVEYRRAWLLKVLYHQFIDARRSDQRSPVRLADTGIHSIEPDEVGKSRWLPEEQTDQLIFSFRILKAMSCLNREHCALVALHDIEGVTLEELQTMTGRPIGTIKAQLHRTRVKLGKLLCKDAVADRHLKAVGGDA